MQCILTIPVHKPIFIYYTAYIYRLGCSFLLDIRVVCISVQVQVISVHIMYIRAALCMYGHLFFLSGRGLLRKSKRTRNSASLTQTGPIYQHATLDGVCMWIQSNHFMEHYT